MSIFFFFKQKTAYEVRISDWSSDVCSSDLCVGMTIRRKRISRVSVSADDRKLMSNKALGFNEAEAEHARSEERRVGKECVSPCRSGWSPYHEKKNRRTTPFCYLNKHTLQRSTSSISLAPGPINLPPI